MAVRLSTDLTRQDGTRVSPEHAEALREAARHEVGQITATQHDDADAPARW